VKEYFPSGIKHPTRAAESYKGTLLDLPLLHNRKTAAANHTTHKNAQREQALKEQIFKAWAKHISDVGEKMGGWEWFGTWTFRKDTHPESAIKAFTRLQHLINRWAYGVRYTQDKRKGMSSIIAIEYQKRDVIHLHTLDAGTRDFRRMRAVDLWFKMAGIARVKPFIKSKGAEGYVSKYILKGRPYEVRGGGDIFLLGPFPTMPPAPSAGAFRPSTSINADPRECEASPEREGGNE